MLTIRAIIHILRIPLPEGILLSSLVFFDTITNAIIDRIRPTGKTVEKKNEIIACFGGGTAALFKAKVSAIVISSPILITSDGIHDYLSTDELEDTIDDYGISLQACEKLIELARQNGSKDDASVIMGGAL